MLVNQDFDLAFRTLHTLGVDPGAAYASAAAALAAAGKTAQLQQLLSNIQGSVSDEQWDQVGTCGLAIVADTKRSNCFSLSTPQFPDCGTIRKYRYCIQLQSWTDLLHNVQFSDAWCLLMG